MACIRSMNPRPVLALLILLTAGSFIAMLVFNTLAANPALSGGLFKHSIGNLSAKYEIKLTPAGWTFSVWAVIYFFEAVWIVYAVTNICRRVGGSPAYVSPCILTPLFFYTFITNHTSNIVWLFTWDQEHIIRAVGVLGLTAVTCITGLSLAYGRLDAFREELEEEGRQFEISFIRIFVFNGAAMYGTWTTIATVLNLGSALAYRGDPPLDQDTTAFICLGIIGALYITFVITDLTFLERFSRFTFAPYGIFLWALAGVLSKNWDPEQTSSIVVAVMAGLGVVGLILKLVVSFWRQKQQPQAYRKLKVWATLGNEVYPSLSIK